MIGIGEIVAVIKLILDKDTWGTLSEIFEALSRKQEDWQSKIESARASFPCTEAFKVGGFLNQLVEGLRDAGVSREQVDRFGRIFNEIVDNAFRHGCKDKTRGKVSILCFYSRWFVLLEVKDPGDGFDLDQAIRKSEGVSRQRGIAHGLQVVNTLSYRVFANEKGNSLTVILAGQPPFQVVSTVESFCGLEILSISVLSDETWYEMIYDWSPLYEIISNSKQNLFLVDLTDVWWPSRAVMQVIERVEGFGERSANTGPWPTVVASPVSNEESEFQDAHPRAEKVSTLPVKGRARFAFLINRGAHYSFGLKSYEEATPPVFREDQRTWAKEWLVSGEVPGAANTVGQAGT